MKKMVLVSIGALVPSLAAAHSSLVPHEHPHAISMLPDIAALLMAAALIGAGAIFLAMKRRAGR